MFRDKATGTRQRVLKMYLKTTDMHFSKAHLLVQDLVLDSFLKQFITVLKKSVKKSIFLYQTFSFCPVIRLLTNNVSLLID